MADEIDLAQPQPRFHEMPRRAHEFVAHELLVQVLGGRFAPGDRMPSERALALELGVSRPTVRQALADLAARGLVESRVGSGTFVIDSRQEREPTPRTATTTSHEVMEARLVLEVGSARLAARRARRHREELSLLGAIVDAVERRADTTLFPTALDVAFHRSIVQLAGNALLGGLVEPCWDAFVHLVAPDLACTWSSDDTARMAAQHTAIFAAVRTADAELAGFEMERHLRAELTRLVAGSDQDPPSRFYA